jgi:hypothetical protein
MSFFLCTTINVGHLLISRRVIITPFALSMSPNPYPWPDDQQSAGNTTCSWELGSDQRGINGHRLWRTCCTCRIRQSNLRSVTCPTRPSCERVTVPLPLLQLLPPACHWMQWSKGLNGASMQSGGATAVAMFCEAGMGLLASSSFMVWSVCDASPLLSPLSYVHNCNMQCPRHGNPSWGLMTPHTRPPRPIVVL